MATMLAWRRFASWCLWLLIPGLLLFWPLGLALFAGLCVCSIGALMYMYRAGASEVGRGYALRQLLLAVILLPVAFLGVFLVTRLVEADLVNWRLARRVGFYPTIDLPRIDGGMKPHPTLRNDRSLVVQIRARE